MIEDMANNVNYYELMEISAEDVCICVLFFFASTLALLMQSLLSLTLFPLFLLP
jgi:hypothetical protein